MNAILTRIVELVRRAARGEEGALAELFSCYRGRLRQMIRLRLDRRLQGRVDPSDVLQDAYIDMAERLPEYAGKAAIPFFVWPFLDGRGRAAPAPPPAPPGRPRMRDAHSRRSRAAPGSVPLEASSRLAGGPASSGRSPRPSFLSRPAGRDDAGTAGGP